MTKQTRSVRDMAFCAMGAVLIALCAWISIPALEIAFTMQTFGVFLILGLLGGRRGTISVGVYLLLGLVGVPVFSGFRGTDALFGVTGGYILGFLGSALTYWLVTSLLGTKFWTQLLGMVLGLLVCYGFGSVWFYTLYLRGGSSIALGAVVAKCVVPYLLPDAVKIALALSLTRRLKRFIP